MYGRVYNLFNEEIHNSQPRTAWNEGDDLESTWKAAVDTVPAKRD
jgi:hypothetical protein